MADNHNFTPVSDPKRYEEELRAEDEAVRTWTEKNQDRILQEYRQMPESNYGKLISQEIIAELTSRMMQREGALPKVSREARAWGSFTNRGVRYFGYYDQSYKTATFDCKCGWSGPFDQLGDGNSEWGDDHPCPKCGALLAWTETFIPRPDDWEEQKLQERREIFKDVPDIPDAEFFLTFEHEPDDEKGGTYRVRYRGKTIYWESAGFEDWIKYVWICKLLKEKYGSRVCDLIQVDVRKMEIWGDGHGASAKMDQARETLWPEYFQRWKRYHRATSEPAPLTSRFDEALTLARTLHREQTRKTSGAPYICHLMSVASLVLQAGGDEDMAIAALLHDAIEDQGAKITLGDIKAKFNARVARIVDDCSERKNDPNLDWKARKEEFIQRARRLPLDSRVVCAADKLDNVRSLLRDYHRMGAEVFEKFNGGKEGTLWFYDRMADALAADEIGTSLTSEFAWVLKQLALKCDPKSELATKRRTWQWN